MANRRVRLKPLKTTAAPGDALIQCDPERWDPSADFSYVCPACGAILWQVKGVEPPRAVTVFRCTRCGTDSSI